MPLADHRHARPVTLRLTVERRCRGRSPIPSGSPGLRLPPRLRGDTLRSGLVALTFLLGGSDGEHLLGEDPALSKGTGNSPDA
jgi:hypothetical protein